jgi:hypothetical protein
MQRFPHTSSQRQTVKGGLAATRCERPKWKSHFVLPPAPQAAETNFHVFLDYFLFAFWAVKLS